MASPTPNALPRRECGAVLKRFNRIAISLAVAMLVASAVRAALPTERALRSRDPDVRAQFRRAIEAFAAREYAPAETLFVQLAEHSGLPEHDHEICLFLVGRCHFARGDYATCRRHYATYLDRFPESEHAPAAWVLIGHCRFYSGDNIGAARAYAEGLTCGPEAHRQIALSNLEPLIRRGLPLSGLESLSDVLGDDRWSAQARFWIAERWARSYRRVEALREFKRVAREAGRTDLGKTAQARIAELESAPATPVIIGLLLPLTGEYRDFGRRAQAAAELAVQVAADSVRLVIIDAGTDPLKAARAADSLVETGCVAVIGPLLSEGIIPSAGVLRAHEVVQILPVVRRDAKYLAAFSPWIIQLSVPADLQARQLALATGPRRGLRRLAALVADTSESRTAVEAFIDAGVEVGSSICALEYFTPGVGDYRVLVRRVAQSISRQSPPIAADSDTLSQGETRSLPVDGLLIWGADPEDLARIVPLAREAGFLCLLLGDQSWEEYRATEAANSLLDSVLYVSDQVMDTADPAWPEFARRCRESAGSDPDWLAARIFDATNFIMAAARRGGTQPLLDRLLLPGMVRGVSGVYEFGPDRVASRAGVFRCVEGQLQSVTSDSGFSPSPPPGQR